MIGNIYMYSIFSDNETKSGAMLTHVSVYNIISWLAQLFLSKERPERDADANLHEQAHPKPPITQPIQVERQVRENRTGSHGVRCRRPTKNRRNRTKHLRCDEREVVMKTCRRLKKHHSEPSPLQRIENTKPKPEGTRDECTACCRRTDDPRKSGTDARNTPESLSPTRCAETDGQHGEEPAVLARKVRKLGEQTDPDKPKEEDYEKENLPGLGV